MITQASAPGHGPCRGTPKHAWTGTTASAHAPSSVEGGSGRGHRRRVEGRGGAGAYPLQHLWEEAVRISPSPEGRLLSCQAKCEYIQPSTKPSNKCTAGGICFEPALILICPVVQATPFIPGSAMQGTPPGVGCGCLSACAARPRS